MLKMKSLMYGCVLALAFSSCSPDKLEDVFRETQIVIPASSSRTGLGANDGIPEGQPFELPEGIIIINRPHDLFDPSPDKLLGNMNTFYSDLHIVRTKYDTSFYTIKLPAGLIFVNRTGSRVQSGILTTEVYVPVSGRQGDTSTVYIGLACINEAMGLPWADNTEDDTRNYPIAKNMHSPMVITADPNLLAVLDLLKDKPGLKLTRHYNPFDSLADDYVMPNWLKIYDQIQQVIWSVTDGHGVTRKEMDELVEALKAYE